MFRKLFLSVAIIAAFFSVSMSDQVLDYIPPTTTTSNTTLSNPGAGLRNCLNEVSLSNNANSILRILDGGTTTYAIDLSTSAASTAIVLQWPTDNPFCTGYNATTTVNVSAGTFKLNYRGVIKGNR